MMQLIPATALPALELLPVDFTRLAIHSAKASFRRDPHIRAVGPLSQPWLLIAAKPCQTTT
jgi:hypothetical protein